MERHTTGRAVALTHTFYVDEGESVATPVAVDVTVTLDGAAAPASSGTATVAGGVWTFAAGALAEGVYDVLWDGGTIIDRTRIEVVGGRLFALAAIREDPDFGASKYGTGKLLSVRSAVEDEFERITGRSFLPVTRRVSFDAAGRDAVWLGAFDARALISVIGSTGTSVDISGFGLDANGVLSGIGGLSGSYTATVAYGFRTVPADVARVAVVRARSLLVADNSGIPDRATTYSPEGGGTFALATPGVGRWRTGIPEVDSVLDGYTYNIGESLIAGLS